MTVFPHRPIEEFRKILLPAADFKNGIYVTANHKGVVFLQHLKNTWKCISATNVNMHGHACCHPIYEKRVEMPFITRHVNTCVVTKCLKVRENAFRHQILEHECCHPVSGKHVEMHFVNKQVNMHVVSQYLKGMWECVSSENMNTSEDACCHPIPEKHMEMHFITKQMDTRVVSQYLSNTWKCIQLTNT
ncbi:hypothetical protein Anapl_14099 [Anas platyrhynchos]|uniref:Uncharacterized protein n=1 Tax=Anas platyrhynchos TaxID=8839 RepID=R0LC41_ANAPL|nr:hypothetical protein Anapl_14099 [Anas platyrhynchos]